MRLRLLPIVLLALLTAFARAGITFSVKVDPKARKDAASGRLIVMLVRAGSTVPAGKEPLEGPFWEDPQPMYGMDIKDVAPGVAVSVDDSASSFPIKLSQLPAGEYRAQARLDVSRSNSNWKRDAGNLYSTPVKFKVDGSDQAVTLLLDKSTTPAKPRPRPGVELFTVKSSLLSTFYGREVSLRAGVAFPLSYNPGAAYSAIYHIPGYGDDYSDAYRGDRSRVAPKSPEEALNRATFAIYLDPESPNGHTLFADSANNGPWAQALIKELIPALETRYRLTSKPEARLLRGHSSGGWSTLWLAVNYPETFGATWSTSPDPVDFREFQVVDIYGQPNFYKDAAGADLNSYRANGKQTMTIRQENLMEEIVGPDNTSAQQWDSWFATFGPRNDQGRPMALFNPQTGEIDHAIAEQYRKYDIADLLRHDPDRYLPILNKNARIMVGDQDNFSLDEAVKLLQADVQKFNTDRKTQPGPGYIRILPGVDHGTIFGRPEMRNIPAEMVEHLTSAGLIGK